MFKFYVAAKDQMDGEGKGDRVTCVLYLLEVKIFKVQLINTFNKNVQKD